MVERLAGWPVGAFERVRAKQVALGLREVLRQACAAERVEVRQAAAHREGWYAVFGGERHDLAPRGLVLLQETKGRAATRKVRSRCCFIMMLSFPF